MKNQRGVTLIALVITIIVLLILAGVSIAMLTGDNGILTQANKSKYNTSRSEAVEKINLALNAIKTEVYAQRVTKANWDPVTSENALEDAITSVLTSDGFQSSDADDKYVYSLDTDTKVLTLSYYSVANADLDSDNKITGKINLDASTNTTFLQITEATLPANS